MYIATYISEIYTTLERHSDYMNKSAYLSVVITSLPGTSGQLLIGCNHVSSTCCGHRPQGVTGVCKVRGHSCVHGVLPQLGSSRESSAAGRQYNTRVVTGIH